MRVMRILTRPNLGGPTMQAIALFHEHRRLGVSTLLVAGACGPGEAAADLAAHGVPAADPDRLGPHSEGFVPLPSLSNRLLPWRRHAARRQLAEWMRAFRPEVVHTHTSAAGLVGREAAHAVGVDRVVHTFHGIVLRDYFGPLLSRWLLQSERRLAGISDALVAVSPSCAQELAELGVAAPERIAVVPPAVPTPAFLPRALARSELGLSADEPAVAAYGRLAPIKRMDRFVAAAASLEAAAHVHGSGPLAASLQRRAGGNVRFFALGERARALLPAYDALLLPSRREGCPLVAVEAFLAGVPVIGFPVPGVRDVLTQWGSGLLASEADGAPGLAAAARSLLADPARRQRLVQASQSGLARFSPAVVAARLLEIYRGLPHPGPGE